ESSVGMPRTDRSMAAPHGCAELIIPYENSITSIADGRVQFSSEHSVYFVGNWDTSTTFHTSSRKTGFIGIEFCPFCAYSFFRIPLDECATRPLLAVGGLHRRRIRMGRGLRTAREGIMPEICNRKREQGEREQRECSRCDLHELLLPR